MPAMCWIRARDADRDVQLRRDDLSGLPHLEVTGGVAGVDRGAAGTERRAEGIGERFEHFVEFLFQGAATADHDAGVTEFGPLALHRFERHEFDAGCGCRGRDLGDALDRRCAAAGSCGVELALARRGDLNGRAEGAVAEGVAGEHGALVDELAAFGGDARAVTRVGGVQAGGPRAAAGLCRSWWRSRRSGRRICRPGRRWP